VPEMLQQVVNKCPKSFEGPLYNNIIIAGGNTHFKGFKDRLEKDLESLRPYDCPVRIFELPNPHQAAWKGLKHFCSNKHTFDEFVVTKREYMEEGARILKKFNM
jgi:actin-related protein